MWRSKHNLTARRVETAKPGRYGDGGGLYLIVSATGARKWVYRFTFGGRVTKMGIGSVRSFRWPRRGTEPTSAQASRRGRKPNAAKRRAARASVGVPTFGVVADELLAAKKSEWRNEEHQAQWLASLTERPDHSAIGGSTRLIPRRCWKF